MKRGYYRVLIKDFKQWFIAHYDDNPNALGREWVLTIDNMPWFYRNSDIKQIGEYLGESYPI